MAHDDLDELLLAARNPFEGGPESVLDLVEALIHRVRRAERALDEINPGWEYGAHFRCDCASCET